MLVGDHRVPAVAALGRGPVARAPAARRSRSAPRRGRGAGGRRPWCRPRSRSRRRRRAARSRARAGAAAAPTGSSVSGSRTETVEGSRPAGASQSLVTSSPPSRTTNELCGRATGSRCEASTSSSGLSRCAQRPKTMCRSPFACAAIPPGQQAPPGSRGVEATTASVSRVEPLDPALDRGRLRAADRHRVAQRVELARFAADEHVGREGVVDRGDLESLAGLDAEPGLARRRAPAPRAAVLAGPGPRPVGAGHRSGPVASRDAEGRDPDLGQGLDRGLGRYARLAAERVEQVALVEQVERARSLGSVGERASGLLGDPLQRVGDELVEAAADRRPARWRSR